MLHKSGNRQKEKKSGAASKKRRLYLVFIRKVYFPDENYLLASFPASAARTSLVTDPSPL